MIIAQQSSLPLRLTGFRNEVDFAEYEAFEAKINPEAKFCQASGWMQTFGLSSAQRGGFQPSAIIQTLAKRKAWKFDQRSNIATGGILLTFCPNGS